MTTIDLSKVEPAQWGEAVVAALNTITAERANNIQHDAQLRALKSREQGLMAELNDVRERIVMLTDASYQRQEAI